MVEDQRQSLLRALDERHDDLVRQLGELHDDVERALAACGAKGPERQFCAGQILRIAQTDC